MSSPAFSVVELFESRVAEFAGAHCGVAVASCTDALLLSCVYRQVKHVTFPARTYISAVAAAIHAGATVGFREYEWSGAYQLEPYEIWDGAGRMTLGMYKGGLHCLSFQAKKMLPIGRGGMILTNDPEAVKWFKKARYDGRNAEIQFMHDNVSMLGWNCYMTPEQAARGLHLLEGFGLNVPDRFTSKDYPDLRKMSVFSRLEEKAA